MAPAGSLHCGCGRAVRHRNWLSVLQALGLAAAPAPRRAG